MNNDLISRSAAVEMLCEKAKGNFVSMFATSGECHVARVVTKECAAEINDMPAVDAEPVRHEGDTTFIATDNLDAYTGRIIVGQGNTCKVYYADEPVRHGRWIWADDGYLRCSECTQKAPITTQYQDEPIQTATNYCPNCGAKMDGDEHSAD